MAAPQGMAHGKVYAPFAHVEMARDMKEFDGKGYKRIAKETGYSVSTIRDWTNYKTRTHG